LKRFFIGVAVVLSLLGAVGSGRAQSSFSYMPFVFKDYCTKALVFLAFGDSITSCHNGTDYGNFPNCGYPGRVLQHLKTSYGRDYAFYNQGVRGEITSDGISRIAYIIADPFNNCGAGTGACLYPTGIPVPSPDLILIMEGTNDLNAGIDPLIIESNLHSMVSTAHQAGKRVIIATITPAFGTAEEERQARIVQFNPRIYEIAAYHQIPIADVYERFVNYPDWETALMDSDGLHPNDRGFEVMAEVFYEVISSNMSAGGCYLPSF
jgi:lysophospholipase L1-like esterase